MLNEILANKKEEVEQQKATVPLATLKERAARQEAKRDFAAALRGSNISLIAEVKRASPSKGLLCPDFDPVKLGATYARGGAAAISVLTESRYFQGSLEHLSQIRDAVNLPLLRKDFIFDPYQVYEAVAYGADAMLLIVAVLSQTQLEELLGLSKSLGLSCLVEVHDEDEVQKALDTSAEIIGINNRDLRTFNVDINTTHKLRSLIPPERIVVSESGINSRDDMEKLREWGVNAALVGEALVTASDIPARMKELIL